MTTPIKAATAGVIGWTISYPILKEISDTVDEQIPEGISLKQVEAVIIELSKRNHVTIV